MVRWRTARRRRTRFLKSGMFDSRNAADGGHEFFPALLLRVEHLATLGRQAVVATAALFGFLDPFALDPALGFEAVQQRVERSDVEAEGAAGADLDQFRDVIAVARLGFQEGEDQELATALFPLGIGFDGRMAHILVSHIWTRGEADC